MFILVTVDAQVFPIRAIGWIVVVIPVFMMDGEQVFIVELKFSAAFGADEPMNFQGLLTVSCGMGFVGTQFPQHFLYGPSRLGFLKPAQFVSSSIRATHCKTPPDMAGLFIR